MEYYNLSTDYQALYDLIDKHRIVNVVNDFHPLIACFLYEDQYSPPSAEIIQTCFKQNRITIGTKTVLDSSSKKEFIDFCVRKKIQWIPSNKD